MPKRSLTGRYLNGGPVALGVFAQIYVQRFESRPFDSKGFLFRDDGAHAGDLCVPSKDRKEMCPRRLLRHAFPDKSVHVNTEIGQGLPYHLAETHLPNSQVRVLHWFPFSDLLCGPASRQSWAWTDRSNLDGRIPQHHPSRRHPHRVAVRWL